MLATLGFLIIAVFLALVITKRMSVITALVLVPLFFAVVAGFSVFQVSEFMLAGVKQVAPTGILLFFAVLYFSVMLDAGLFDPVISFIVEQVKGDPLKVIVGTAILTMLVHLDGDGTATFMIVTSAFLQIYRLLNIDRRILAGIIALSVGPMHLVPWSGTSARAISTLNASAVQVFNPNIPSIIGGLVWVFIVAVIFGKRERKRLGVVSFDYNHVQSLSEEQQSLRRPRLVAVNAILTITLIVMLMTGSVAAPPLFIVFSVLALMVNYPKLHEQNKVLKSHGNNIFLVSGMIFAAGIFSGILSGTKMIDAMAESLVSLIPQQHGNLLPVLTAVTSMPSSLLFTPDAYYFGVVPILSQSAQHFNIDPLEIGRAALLGQMTVGFPLSPLTASTFLLIGLCEIDLGDHQKFVFKWAVGTTLIMTIIALLTGSISI